MYISEFNFTNNSQRDLIIIFEPSGEEYILKPKAKCRIACKSSAMEPMEFEYSDEYAIIYSWDYSII